MTSGLGVVMSSSAQIVLISVDNNRSADNRVFTSKLDQLIFNFVHGFVPGPSRDDVSQITNVSFFVGGATMSLTERVEVTSGSGASIAQISEF
eukprot:CAMPEP_0115013276 /NCGR_PEP_ID=MMETSP0216-20121206/25300_1 /TAXON_ID=223996 /ORGANISM="Protocruzia adherens, Strain Boccale" /LENGTH=92 /DNA_ID=CAMNT_0002382621 /DNA_START=535 /DNA_END=810 /DNA_ORIENTATION=-